MLPHSVLAPICCAVATSPTWRFGFKWAKLLKQRQNKKPVNLVCPGRRFGLFPSDFPD